jgi:hypothetical protein
MISSVTTNGECSLTREIDPSDHQVIYTLTVGVVSVTCDGMCSPCDRGREGYDQEFDTFVTGLGDIAGAITGGAAYASDHGTLRVTNGIAEFIVVCEYGSVDALADIKLTASQSVSFASLLTNEVNDYREGFRP